MENVRKNIPIRRTNRKYILRVGSIERYMKKILTTFPQSKPTYSTNNNNTHEVYKYHLKSIWKP